MILDVGDTFLITLQTPKKVGGKTYPQVWGPTTCEIVGSEVFVKVGGFGNEILIAPAEVKTALACADAPQDSDVLVLGQEFEDMAGIAEEAALIHRNSHTPALAGTAN